MKTIIKSALPALTFLLLGMLIFFSLGSVPVPPVFQDKFGLGVAVSIVFLLLSTAFLRCEKRTLSSMHLIPNKQTLLRLSLGLLIGGLMVGVMLLVLFSFTDLGIDRIENQTVMPFLIAAAAFIPLALMEELLFRGYPFFRLAQMINIRWVLLITATLFALYHYNGTQNIATLFIGPGVWGVAFGVAAYLSKSIAVPLGMHISANALQALFGLKPDYVSIWEVTQVVNATAAIEPDHLGIAMQLIVLVLSVFVLEIWMRSKGLNQLGNGHVEMKGMT